MAGGHVSDNACQNSLNDCAEANLDVQYLMAVCQSTPTNYYYWNSTTDYWEGFLIDLSNRVTSATPLVVSISYGSREYYFSTSYLRSFNIEALKLAAQGVTLIASSGDDGANYLYSMVPYVQQKNGCACFSRRGKRAQSFQMLLIRLCFRPQSTRSLVQGAGGVFFLVNSLKSAFL